MKFLKRWTVVMMAAVLGFAPLSFAKDPDKAKDQEDRIHNADMVMKEILGVPNYIPRNILDKARCVIVMPSVLKAAFIVGGSYGRGTMVCRTGKDFPRASPCRRAAADVGELPAPAFCNGALLSISVIARERTTRSPASTPAT